MRILDGPVTKDELKSIAGDMFGDLVKGVVDVRLDLLAIDAELHSDLEAMINMRPSQGNLSRGVDDDVT